MSDNLFTKENVFSIYDFQKHFCTKNMVFKLPIAVEICNKKIDLKQILNFFLQTESFMKIEKIFCFFTKINEVTYIIIESKNKKHTEEIKSFLELFSFLSNYENRDYRYLVNFYAVQQGFRNAGDLLNTLNQEKNNFFDLLEET